MNAPTGSSPIASIFISGNNVGLLDPTQKTRLLNTPGSILSFATFHPRTATRSQDNARKLSMREELCSLKRVVIETLPTGESFWRWVPRARGVESVEEEGQWPRVIEICGQYVHCSQEQWDIYKIDPEYDCHVRAPPQITVISRRKGKEKAPQKSPSQSARTSPSYSKRRMSPTLDTHSPSPTKRRRRVHVDSDTDDGDLHDEDEVAEMIIDDFSVSSGSQSINFKQYLKPRHDEIEQNRKSRREKIAARRWKRGESELQDLSMLDLTIDDDISPQSTEYYYENGASSYNGKRRPDPDDEGSKKRARRTRSPSSAKQDANGQRFKRGDWQGRLNQRLRGWRERRDEILLESIRASVPLYSAERHEPHADTNGYYQTEGTPEQEYLQEEDPLSLEEKIRRMAEMNTYEQIRANVKAERRKAEQAEAERMKREEEQRVRAAQERLEREKEQERKRRQQEEERWSYGPWTIQRALERYKSLSEAFDAAKFTPGSPITFRDIPWPVLHKPATFTAQDVDWNSVEAFFDTVRPHMKGQDYKTFVEKSHRRFHPDRWRARRVLQSVEDDELRACMEVAANTVAQALTPLWRDVKG